MTAIHHSDETKNAKGSKDYSAEPHAYSSWDGTVAGFSSVWRSSFSHYDEYIVTGNWR